MRRHQARLQYGLFLKGVGLTLEESLEFWKSEFSRAPGAVNFDSHYAYSIRHNYGTPLPVQCNMTSTQARRAARRTTTPTAAPKSF
jgi:DNA primase large subunit